MGIRIQDNVVIVDHANPDHLETTIDKNPTKDSIEGLPVYSVFERKFSSAKKSRQRDTRLRGDNCPLIYALKGKDDLTVRFSSIKTLNENIPHIIQKIRDELNGEIDVVLSMPSSSPLSAILGKRMAIALKKGHTNELFRKASNSYAMEAAQRILEENPRQLSWSHEVDLRNCIQYLRRTPDEAFQAKNVKASIRKFFNPIILETAAKVILKEKRVLLVDDLLATGETLKSAWTQLSNSGIEANHQAVTWFSRVSTKKSR